ncbi:hypothetical protein BJX70DRAFT_401535 [Aspergillus crustosus]
MPSIHKVGTTIGLVMPQYKRKTFTTFEKTEKDTGDKIEQPLLQESSTTTSLGPPPPYHHLQLPPTYHSEIQSYTAASASQSTPQSQLQLQDQPTLKSIITPFNHRLRKKFERFLKISGFVGKKTGKIGGYILLAVVKMPFEVLDLALVLVGGVVTLVVVVPCMLVGNYVAGYFE